MSDRQDPQYIGDGVYAYFDGYQVWIHTSDGVRESEAIALERPTMNSLILYALKHYVDPEPTAPNVASKSAG